MKPIFPQLTKIVRPSKNMNYLEKFQYKNGLVSNGILGKNTFAKMKEVFGISSNEKLAHFLGQVSHESMGFSVGEENLNYSAKGLRTIFRKYFTVKDSIFYARKPEKIANIVYANRMGNGNEASGDGWKHRGMGAIQLTGKNNQELFANKIRDLKILNNPKIIAEKYFFESALFFFNENRLWDLCEEVNDDAIEVLTRRINGGINGLDDRIDLTNRYYSMVK